jgi:hypothetical protein
MKEEIIAVREKKVYVTPAISTVKLVAGEAVLGACKDGAGNLTLCQGALSVCTPSEASS